MPQSLKKTHDSLLIEDFLEHLFVERGLSNNTITSYQGDLHQFKSFLNKIRINSFTSISEDHVSLFVKSFDELGYQKATRSRKLATLKSFYSYLHDEHLLTSNPTQNFTLDFKFVRLPKIFDISEVSMILDAPFKISTGHVAIRDHAMLQIAYAAGLRVSEIINLNLGDVDFTSSSVRCFGKGSKERIIPIHDLALQSLNDYVHKSRPLMIKSIKNKSFFCNQKGQRLTRQGFWKIVKKYAENAQIENGFTPHSLRHCFATHLLNGGAPLRHVQALLGHSSIATTQIYTHLTKQFVRDEYDFSHPRSQKKI